MSRVLRITDANTRKISNAVFDNWTSGVPDGWTATGSPTTAQTISEGTIQTFASAYALDIRNASTQAIRGYYQDVTDVNSGQTYYISVYVKPVTGNVRLYAWDGGGTSNAVFVESSGTEWQQLIVEKTAVSTGIRIGLIAFDAGSQAVFDLVQLATFNIEFIEGVYSTFFRVTNWEIQVPDYKGSGVFSSSPVAEGRKLIDGYWDNVTQTITFHLRGDGDTDITTQNAAAEKLSELFNALQAARDFSKTSWVRDPVYMQYKADNETNYRYAFIANARIPQLSDQYNIEFAQLVMLDLDLIIEHPVAFGMPPGEGAPILSGIQFSYNSQNYGDYDENGDALNTADWVYFGNYHLQNSITNMHQGTGGANQIGGSLPRTIVTSGGTVYFGISSAVSGAGPLTHIVFDISRVATGGTSGNWQVWNGSTWANAGTLIQDRTSGFTLAGKRSITIAYGSATSRTFSPGGSLPTGYWIRYVSSGTYTITPQIRTEPYTVSGNYMDFRLPIDGNIPAVLAIEATSEGRVTSDEKIERVIGGLRSISRGENFQSIINLTGSQNHSDITITYSNVSVAALSNYYPNQTDGQVARSTNAGEAYVQIAISGNLVQEYEGEFRVFMAAGKDTAATVSAHLEYQQAPGLPFEVNDAVEVSGFASQAKILYDLGVMKIDNFGSEGFYNDTVIMRLYTTADTTDDLDRTIVCLIPVDEYQFDAAMITESVADESAWIANATDYAHIGSAFSAKQMNRTHFIISPAANSDVVQMRYGVKSNGPAVLQSNERQRLYFLLMGDGSFLDGVLFYYHQNRAIIRARPTINPRYLGMRGSQ